jgi:predicted DNA-binding transcriptional regulator AlpA
VSCVGQHISRETFAEKLNVSLSFLFSQEKAGKLGPKPIRIGRAVRWDCAEVEAWLQAGAPPRSRWDTLRPHVIGQR